jgi:hypothetical protein
MRKCETVAAFALLPLRRAEQLDSMGGLRRALCTCDPLSAAAFVGRRQDSGLGAKDSIKKRPLGRAAVAVRFLLFSPLWRAEQLDSMWSIRRALFESRSEARCVRLARSSCAVATSRQAAQGYPVNTGRDTRGGLPLVTFLGRARKVTSRRAAPGLLFTIGFRATLA